jgi:LDH2 family malate/lactate/ureidoglycolate dehydrogenase
MLALDPAGFAPMDVFRRRVDEFIDGVKASPKRPGVTEILYPGEGSQRLKRQRKQAGIIAIPASQYHGMSELAKEIGMAGAI